MGIVIQTIIEQVGSRVRAQILHGESIFIAHIEDDTKKLQTKIDTPLIVEMAYDRIISWQPIQDFEDTQSGLFCYKADESIIAIRGRVHNSIDIGPDQAVIDLYLMNFADFVAIDSDELKGFVSLQGDN